MFLKRGGIRACAPLLPPPKSHKSGFTAYPAQTGNGLNMLQKTLVKPKMEI